MDPRVKSLKIKTGVVKRCGKEKLSYRQEADQQKDKVEQMKKEGRDDAEVKKMIEVMQESLMMIPDCHRRLEKAYAELQALVQGEMKDLTETEEYRSAQQVLTEAEEQLKVA
ncbi:hypothetical protein TCAL_02140 [Tigriopus californicus]|uniref:Tubulin-specific chaperone A n=1 Tax=Tigriopus californicus TaxID=6832 RepID=A0A553N839_TIGCA|nr:tubulin-specific chaperone A-like [Tigriopus californicus]TRY61588.1 hypothetical protein TCAL_02140 [Tigriopus californicus]|eukprot:TCALIF_02140-PA protein Name:"Similar to TBCA Tubulin-specific chaperone A (Homo sapiens)" AED:0.01 eAED:0.01 QI:0/-1/0/1/-1/1/1/0/111